ncbi:HlyD family type I secretion periplasmic adaptor subunit [Ramlibacter sp.]|uniref:HlyD family type I secretion periplasmic adaptor subunit n=1 Tax=Ramlibacter sp. TaxID=1917967 RepID=UPI002D717424|nr:HlyD family type I secretion periplasmic adaptor subunit [Ramlibacter sp.]HYD78114.1 HlyD family type I secretion periplasmic adaptor subunit [Ramlibacter sp.]
MTRSGESGSPAGALPRDRRSEAADFAPDILRVQASPPGPLPRAVLGTTLALLACALAWAVFGKLDIVAVAPGRLVPQSALKIVQPAEAGIVKEILVVEGELVRAGQVLMRMDPTLSAAELDALRRELAQKELALRRIDAQLAEGALEPRAQDPRDLFEQAHAQMQANRLALESALAQERATAERARQELATARALLSKLEQTLPHYREQDAAYRNLVREGFAGRLMAEDKARERIEKEQDLDAQRHAVERERANVAVSERRLAQIRSDYVRQLRSERAALVERLEKLRPELAKQGHRHALLELRAPQQGRIKDLATRTAGTVVQPGTILMTLVPASDVLQAEVWLSNEDVGFVRSGLPARLKLAAFQFQKYGMLDATVEQVAADAAAPQETPGEGAQPALRAYRTLLGLQQQWLVADGVSHRLASGMQVAAEIKLGERTVLEYLLSPVRQAFHEAGRER